MNEKIVRYYQSLKKDKQGALVNARFGYQKYWALREAYRLFENGEDFYVVFEGLEDIDVLKNDEIHAYQVKTKDNHVFYTYAMMTKKDKETGKSILSKLSEKEDILYIKSLNLVTNLPFENSYNRSDKTYDSKLTPFVSLNDDFNKKVKDHIYGAREKQPDLSKYNFIHSDLPLNKTRETMIGITSDFLRNNSSSERVSAFFDFIDSETEQRMRNIDSDNLEEKSISKSYLQNLLNKYEQTHNDFMNRCLAISKMYDVLKQRNLNNCFSKMNKESFDSICIRNTNEKVFNCIEKNKTFIGSYNEKELCDFLYQIIDFGELVLEDDKLAYIIAGVVNYILGGRQNE